MCCRSDYESRRQVVRGPLWGSLLLARICSRASRGVVGERYGMPVFVGAAAGAGGIVFAATIPVRSPGNQPCGLVAPHKGAVERLASPD